MRAYLSDLPASVVTQPVAEREGKPKLNPATTSARRRSQLPEFRARWYTAAGPRRTWQRIRCDLITVRSIDAIKRRKVFRQAAIVSGDQSQSSFPSCQAHGDGADGLAFNEGADVGGCCSGSRQGISERFLSNSVFVPTSAYDVLCHVRYL